jgi:diamine N-acetyltransferase
MNNSLLVGSKIQLRALEPEDLELLYNWENDTEIWNVSETLSPISRFILKRYLENSHKDIFETKQLRLVIQLIDNKKAIGTIDLFNFDPYHKRAAVGVLIADKSNRKKGYASESLKILLNYCKEILKLHQLYCSISIDNETSLELFQQTGFEISGTRKEWNWIGTGFSDEYFLQIIL